MATIPEFILRKLYVPGSLEISPQGFHFALHNTLTPATVTRLKVSVDGQEVPGEAVWLQVAGEPARSGDSLSPENPLPLPVGGRYLVEVKGCTPKAGRVRLLVDTRQAGELSFSLPQEGVLQRPAQHVRRQLHLPGRWLPALRATAEVDRDAIIGTIQPYVYGQFIEHLERCLYDGIWSADGKELRPDTLALIQALSPPVIRYPGGNFASGYHWEDGIGPRRERPARFDRAWQAEESNQVGTDEFLAFCRATGADPFLVANDGSGSPEEAARWVAYCNESASGEQGQRRAANGHPEPYNVRLWGVGNEVWGPWQIGHSGARDYVRRLKPFIAAMREVDPEIKIVAVGDKILTDDPQDPGRKWNAAVLHGAGDQIDYLSFHLYQPDRSGWQEQYDLHDLHATVTAAPLVAEAIIQRLAAQVRKLVPTRQIGIALDEWNLWLAPPPGAGSMHQVSYTQRDALYAAGMLNVFQRQCNDLSLANLAQLVNVLPLIVTRPGDRPGGHPDGGAGSGPGAYTTPLYEPFWLYRHMQAVALRAQVVSPQFNSPALGDIPAMRAVPYLDLTATRDRAGEHLALGLINRHPERAMRVSLGLRGFPRLASEEAWLLAADPLASNSFDEPEAVKARPAALPELQRGGLELELPPAALWVGTFRKV